MIPTNVTAQIPGLLDSGPGFMDLLQDPEFLKMLMGSGLFDSLMGSQNAPPPSGGIGTVQAPRFSLLDSLGGRF
jgi:hypothetical protein